MIRKRQFVVVAMCLLIVAGAYVTNQKESPVKSVMNTDYSPSPTPTKIYGEAQFVNGEGEDYFSQARLNRDRARGEALDVLREVTENTGADPEQLEQAVASMSRMANATEQESKLENELKAKGFGDVIVFISESGATVTLSSQKLKEEEMSKILSSVITETGFGADKIKIIEIK